VNPLWPRPEPPKPWGGDEHTAGLLVWENLEAEVANPRHMSGVPREKVLAGATRALVRVLGRLPSCYVQLVTGVTPLGREERTAAPPTATVVPFMGDSPECPLVLRVAFVTGGEAGWKGVPRCAGLRWLPF